MTWLLWLLFVAEYALRLVIAPSSIEFLGRTWRQLLFLTIPVPCAAAGLLARR